MADALWLCGLPSIEIRAWQACAEGVPLCPAPPLAAYRCAILKRQSDLTRRAAQDCGSPAERSPRSGAGRTPSGPRWNWSISTPRPFYAGGTSLALGGPSPHSGKPAAPPMTLGKGAWHDGVAFERRQFELGDEADQSLLPQGKMAAR